MRRPVRHRAKTVCPYCGGLVQAILDETVIGEHQDDLGLRCNASGAKVIPGTVIQHEDAPELWRHGLGVHRGGEEARRLGLDRSGWRPLKRPRARA